MRHALLFFFSLCCSFCMAQNLVPNPSFEDTLECPDFPGQVWRAEGWYAVENTPDYFHSCCNETHPVCGVPDNDWGGRYAATGIAYCGIWAYIAYPSPDYSEKIGIRLLTPLEKGIRYYVAMKVSSVSNLHGQVANGAINKLGMFFSTYKIDNLPPNNNYSQFYSDSIITDTIGWTIIKGSFIADSAYEYLTIGNFFDNEHTDTIRYWEIPGNPGNKQVAAYYFIDDVCVSKDSISCVGEYTGIAVRENRKKELTVYPNPANNHLSIETEIETLGFLEFFASDGQILLRQKIPKGSYSFNQDISQIENGIYFLKLVTENQILTQKIIIHH